MLVLLRTEKRNENLLAVQVLVEGNLHSLFVSFFSSSDVTSVRGGAETQSNVVGAAKDWHGALAPGIETIGEKITQRYGNIIICKEEVRIGDTLEPCRDICKADDNLIGVISARQVIVLKRKTKAALAVSISIAENSGLPSEMLVADLDAKVDSNSSAKAMLSRDLTKNGEENASREAVAHCVPSD